MATVAVAPNVQLHKENKFSARKVPDFAKLHALEDARLARWKREHKKEVTVPLNFRLSQPPLSNGQTGSALATSAKAYYYAQDTAQGIQSSRGAAYHRGAPPSVGRIAGDSCASSLCSESIGPSDAYSYSGKGITKQRDTRDQNVQGAENYKENEAGPGHYNNVPRSGPPSTSILYPSAFNKSHQTGENPAQHLNISKATFNNANSSAALHGRQQSSSGFSDVTDVLSRGDPSHAQQQRPRASAAGGGAAYTSDLSSTQSSSDASRAPTLNSQDRPPAAVRPAAEAVKGVSTATSIPAVATGAAAAASTEPVSSRRAVGGSGDTDHAHAEAQRAGGVSGAPQAGSAHSTAHAASASSVNATGTAAAAAGGAGGGVSGGGAGVEKAREVDVEQLRRMIGTLREDTVVQPFSSMDFYSFGRTLGQGAYGKVKLGTHLLTGEKVAVKTFEKSRLTEPHARKRVSREIRILKALNHPNIIRLYEVVDVPLRKFLIMQFSSGGDLCRYVRENRRLSEQEACRLFCQIVEGLLYCHMSGIVHRDVKLDNLLIDEDRNVKIVDFGFSVSFKEGQKLRKACGSPSYAAPEIVARRPYNPTGVDVWSLGVVLYAMVCGYFPFQGSSNQDLCRRIVKGKFDCPAFMTPEAKDLVKRMLTVDATKRITLRETQEHVWCRAAFQRLERPIVPIRQIECEESENSVCGVQPEEEMEVDVDESILQLLITMGFRRDYAYKCVRRNMHNVCSTTYWLLVHRRDNQRKAALRPPPAAAPAAAAAGAAPPVQAAGGGGGGGGGGSAPASAQASAVDGTGATSQQVSSATAADLSSGAVSSAGGGAGPGALTSGSGAFTTKRMMV